ERNLAYTTRAPRLEPPDPQHPAPCVAAILGAVVEDALRSHYAKEVEGIIAALKAAIRARQPPKGCIHHSDRGSQYACEAYRKLLASHGFVGSMCRRGNPYDNAR